MKVVAFYTVKTPYEKEVLHLEDSCKHFKLDYHLEGYEGRGNWVSNCAIKPEFILEMLTRFPDKSLLYVDADAEFKRHPTVIFDIDKAGTVDIAAHIMTGGVLLSGTVYFRNNEKVRQLVLEWINLQKAWPDRWDQRTLHETIVNHGPRLDIVFKELPREYTRIHDKPWGAPVIQHNQASRRFRNLVNDSLLEGVPSSYAGQRVHVHADGSFTIPRNHRIAEAYFDKNFKRCKGELRWVKTTHPSLPMGALHDIFYGRKCYVIGKGPSLDNLTEEAFDEPLAPVICLNEAIHHVELLQIKNPIFALQQDMGLRNNCKPFRGTMLVSTHAQHWYADMPNKYIYDPDDYECKGSTLSALCAIAIAKKYGAVSFDLISFDACVNKATEYATCIGYKSSKGGDPSRFLKHRKYIDNILGTMPVNWVIPRAAPSSASACIQPQQ